MKYNLEDIKGIITDLRKLEYDHLDQDLWLGELLAAVLILELQNRK